MHSCSTCLSSRVLTDATASPATTDISTLCCFCRRERKALAVHVLCFQDGSPQPLCSQAPPTPQPLPTLVSVPSPLPSQNSLFI